MSKSVQTIGSFGTIEGDCKNGSITATFTSDKKGETLSLLFSQECKITTPFAPVDAVIRKVKTGLLLGTTMTSGYLEDEALSTGFFMKGKGMPTSKSGEVHINFRSNSEQEMLSLAFEDKGEISAFYAPIELLIKEVRGGNQ